MRVAVRITSRRSRIRCENATELFCFLLEKVAARRLSGGSLSVLSQAHTQAHRFVPTHARIETPALSEEEEEEERGIKATGLTLSTSRHTVPDSASPPPPSPFPRALVGSMTRTNERSNRIDVTPGTPSFARWTGLACSALPRMPVGAQQEQRKPRGEKGMSRVAAALARETGSGPETAEEDEEEVALGFKAEVGVWRRIGGRRCCRR